jgi:HD-GYP domain-containing protein (c-di-GMP phosphodiesterase class II)
MTHAHQTAASGQNQSSTQQVASIGSDPQNAIASSVQQNQQSGHSEHGTQHDPPRPTPTSHPAADEHKHLETQQTQQAQQAQAQQKQQQQKAAEVQQAQQHADAMRTQQADDAARELQNDQTLLQNAIIGLQPEQQGTVMKNFGLLPPDQQKQLVSGLSQMPDDQLRRMLNDMGLLSDDGGSNSSAAPAGGPATAPSASAANATGAPRPITAAGAGTASQTDPHLQAAAVAPLPEDGNGVDTGANAANSATPTPLVASAFPAPASRPGDSSATAPAAAHAADTRNALTPPGDPSQTPHATDGMVSAAAAGQAAQPRASEQVPAHAIDQTDDSPATHTIDAAARPTANVPGFAPPRPQLASAQPPVMQPRRAEADSNATSGQTPAPDATPAPSAAGATHASASAATHSATTASQTPHAAPPVATPSTPAASPTETSESRSHADGTNDRAEAINDAAASSHGTPNLPSNSSMPARPGAASRQTSVEREQDDKDVTTQSAAAAGSALSTATSAAMSHHNVLQKENASANSNDVNAISGPNAPGKIVEEAGDADPSNQHPFGGGDMADQQHASGQSTTESVNEAEQAAQQQRAQQTQRTQQANLEALRQSNEGGQVIMQKLQAEGKPDSANVQQAVEHSSSVIGLILKKAYPKEQDRQKDAGKFVAMILRSHGFYTYEHSTRLIDLATDLAGRIGKKDPETQQKLADGIRYKDLGEVDYLLSKGTPRQREALTQFLSGMGMAQASMLHDIGKIKIPKEILYKPGMLTPDEARTMQMHPIYGAQILESIPPLRHAAPAARHHHERYDGKGYPDKLKGQAIPFEARVIAIVDTFDAMAADRPYRKGMSLDTCRSELLKGRGKQFDPELVEAFMDVLTDKFVKGKMSMEDYKLGPNA